MRRPMPDRPARTAAMVAVMIAAAAPAVAASRLNVGLNQSLRVPLGGYASSVVVANPSIADVTMVDSHSAIIIGKANGSAEVMVLDAAGKTLLDSIVTVSAAGDRGGQEGVITLFLGASPHEFVCTPHCSGDGVKTSDTADAAGPSMDPRKGLNFISGRLNSD